MIEYNQRVRDYIQAGERLLKVDNLTDDEADLVRDMIERISIELLEGKKSVDVQENLELGE